MPLSDSQKWQLKGFLTAETDPTLQTFLSQRADVQITAWLNADHASVKAWRNNVTRKEMFDVMNLASFDGFTAGKRDSWAMLMDNAPVDFGLAAIRRAITDVWGAANAGSDAERVLDAGFRAASRLENYFGGTSRTTGTRTGLQLNVYGPVTLSEVSHALNMPSAPVGKPQIRALSGKASEDISEDIGNMLKRREEQRKLEQDAINQQLEKDAESIRKWQEDRKEEVELRKQEEKLKEKRESKARSRKGGRK